MTLRDNIRRALRAECKTDFLSLLDSARREKVLNIDRSTERFEFKSKGWTYRSAAPVLGVSYQYLCKALKGNIQAASLMEKVRNLTVSPVPAKHHSGGTNRVRKTPIYMESTQVAAKGAEAYQNLVQKLHEIEA